MFRNCHYDGRTNTIHLWEQINNQRLYTKIPWVPYVFEESEEGNIKTIDGKSVEKIEFSNGGEYRSYTKDNNSCYENKVLPAVQFLAERYHSFDDEELEVPKLKIYSLDIEVSTAAGFPNPKEAEDPISVINIKEFNGSSISWGIGKYTGEYNLQYKYFNDEKKLLKNFLNYMMSNAPDVLTGWNISTDTKMNKYGGFDLLYIINRCKYLFGEDTNEYKKLSPIRQVMLRENTDGTHVIDIAGVSILDYLPIFKWYTTKNLPDNRLETVCQEELGVGKLDHSEYGSFQEFYKKNYNLYVDYNAIDNQRIEDLENKLGYISLVQQLSLLCKMPMKYYSAATHAGEGLLLTYYRRNGLCAPKMIGGTQEWFPAAYVKEPQKGLHSWVSDLDIASSYPTAMVTLNMSIETYYGRILTVDKVKRMSLNHNTEYNEERIIKYAEQKCFEDPFYFKTNTGIKLIKDEKLTLFNKAIERGMISISPCGSCFLTKPEGVIAHIERITFLKRKEVKRKMFQLEKQESSDENIKNKIKQLFAFQWALKIIINGNFGILAVPYSRYFNVDIAEAVTSCGKLNVLKGQEFANELLNNPNDHLKDVINEIKSRGKS